MKRCIHMALKVFGLSAMIFTAYTAFSQELKITVDNPTVELSPYLYGLFFEDINYGADGGLYAELIQNRSFEYFPIAGKQNGSGHLHTPMEAWETRYTDGAAGYIYVTRTTPLNENNLNNLEIISHNDNGFIGVVNTGYDGILLRQGEQYNLSFYCKVMPTNYKERKITVRLEDESGNVLDSYDISASGLNRSWNKYTHVFTPSASTSKGRLAVLVHGRGQYKFDMISLMPQDTYKGHANGLRKDLAEALEDLNPKVLRFPGGCVIHGNDLDNIYNWKHTVGDVAERKPNWNRWGYHQTYGLGYYEYFQLCEDLGATPLPVIPVGVSCGFCDFEAVPMDELDGPIQDMLDLVEFANGDTTTTWGKLRADMGHPEPFGLKYVCLGNEEHNTPEFKERMPKFVEAMRAEYPEIKIIGNSGLGAGIPLYNQMADLKVWSSDEHYYNNAEWYINNQDRFDNWDRSKPKVFIGEYAAHGAPAGNNNRLYNAITEAIYLTGVERNGDLVEMACYAPLFARYGNTQWKAANLIYFNNETVVKTPNYYVQQMFAQNKGDYYLANEKINWPGKELAVSTAIDKNLDEVIIKVANASGKPQQLDINLEGVKRVDSKGTLISLSGDKDAANTLENPENIKPVNSTVKVGKEFTMEIPEYSVEFLRIKIKK